LDIDLNLKDNRLSVLNDKVVIESYNSKLAFHHHKITTTGRGKIHGRSFDIRKKFNQALALSVNVARDFNL
jgi:hypothetical protein